MGLGKTVQFLALVAYKKLTNSTNKHEIFYQQVEIEHQKTVDKDTIKKIPIHCMICNDYCSFIDDQSVVDCSNCMSKYNLLCCIDDQIDILTMGKPVYCPICLIKQVVIWLFLHFNLCRFKLIIFSLRVLF